MSKQRGTQSTSSGRSSQSGSSTRASARTATQDQEFVGGQSTTQPTTPSTTQAGAQVDTQARGVTEQAKELAGQVQQKATQRVESGLARGKTQAAQTLNTVAESLLFSGQQLRERNQENVSRYIDQAADRVRRVSNYLQNNDVSEIVDRTEEFARRRPALFLGGAFALGLLGARFLKSSRRQVTAGGQFAAGGARGGYGYSRERTTTGFEQEVPTPRAQQEWAAGGVGVSEGLADFPRSSTETQPLGESGFGRRAPIDYRSGLEPGGSEASQR